VEKKQRGECRKGWVGVGATRRTLGEESGGVGVGGRKGKAWGGVKEGEVGTGEEEERGIR